MKTSRLEKFAPLSGGASVLILMLGSGILGVYDYLPSSDRLSEYFNLNPTRIMLVGYLGLFAAILMLWFTGSVYAAFSEHEAGSRRLSMIAFGGGVASSIVLGLGFTAIVAIGARAGAADRISPAEAVTLYDLYGTMLGQMAAFTFAVLIGATAVLTLRTALFPNWFGWASVIIVLGLISPFGYSALAFVLLWLVGVSVALYRRTT